MVDSVDGQRRVRDCGVKREARSRWAGGVDRRFVRSAHVSLVVGVVFLLIAGARPVYAYEPEPVVSENLETVADHAARGGAVGIPGVDCGSRCADFWIQEHRPMPGQPSSRQLHRELRWLRIKARVLPPLRVLGTVGLAAGTFELGWKIGTGIRTKLLTLEVPEHTPWNPSWPQRLRFMTQGSSVYTGLTFPYDGWAWEWNPGGYWRAFWVTPMGNGTDYGCPATYHPPALPPGFSDVVGAPHPNCDAANNGGGDGGVAHVAAITEDALGAPGPVEDYVSQPFTRDICCWTDQPQTRTQLEDRIRIGLDSGEAPMASEWLAHQLDPQTHSDPTEDEEQLTECRPTDQIPSGDPAPTRGSQDFLQDPARWRARYEPVPAAQFPAGSAVPESGVTATGGSAYMRWGWTTLDAQAPSDWEGWGFRKIVAKHGWGPTALARTQAALQTAPTTEGRYDEYVLPEPYSGRTGNLCEWVVVVQRTPNETAANPELSQAAPMGGIITAHGRYVRPS